MTCQHVTTPAAFVPLLVTTSVLTGCWLLAFVIVQIIAEVPWAQTFVNIWALEHSTSLDDIEMGVMHDAQLNHTPPPVPTMSYPPPSLIQSVDIPQPHVILSMLRTHLKCDFCDGLHHHTMMHTCPLYQEAQGGNTSVKTE
ncbi:hypothetical protein DL93DRAFT_2088030 [Clavulina sp. PMI_390]|nr:hypothetical protein DL93DRAFT_2088030 [Clavulina sp. PMI_390]